MNKEHQRISIATFCGFENIHKNEVTNFLQGNRKNRAVQLLPRYCSNLNAIREAEILIAKKGLAWEYSKILLKILGDVKGEVYVGCWYGATAKAEQKAEAILKTVGLWEES